ncbi:hypothetical protein GCM10011575_38600 [Microlunatus endophyticus]|uniref:Transposase IS116/IS110/IS902 C-terminal domain-containing protein n=1 Tax=Microlunatus endophyticus TaxID=1716077 RepID=A0A917SEY5_9ACTN|nr:hypothetical protein GCM10011575_38600 [Microlunatus endophyticus]
MDKELAAEALTDSAVARLMTIPGVDAIAGIAIVAAVGDFSRFDSPDKLVSYVGLNPRVRQSGNSAPVHGRICMGASPRLAAPTSAVCWSKPPGRPAERLDRCGRFINASKLAAAFRKRSSQPRGR